VNLLPETATALLYLLAAVCFVLALKGLSSPRTARRGNLIGAAGAAVAMATVFASTDLDNLGWILGAIAVGSLAAVPAARRVRMTAMPQLVALFNGVGGGAAALVALLELDSVTGWAASLAVAFTVPRSRPRPSHSWTRIFASYSSVGSCLRSFSASASARSSIRPTSGSLFWAS